MIIKRMGITEILRRLWLFSANKIKISESFSEQPTQFIIELNSSLRQKLDTIVTTKIIKNYFTFNGFWVIIAKVGSSTFGSTKGLANIPKTSAS